MNLKNLNFFDEYPGFYETGTTGAGAKVLNLRFHPLIGKNLDILKDATVLDIASHDGRWSFAALKNGAKKVYGIEGKKELVQNSIENMKKYGIAEERYHFVVGDIFEEIKKIPINEIDIVFCLGIFYHISSHMELLREIKKLNQIPSLQLFEFVKSHIIHRINYYLLRNLLLDELVVLH